MTFPGIFPISFFKTGSIIDSIEAFTVTIASNQSTGTATINSVDTSRSVVFFGNYKTTFASTTLREFSTRVTLLNSTTIRATRGDTDPSTCTAVGYVVQFKASAVVSVQYTTITCTNAVGSNTATISSINTANSVVFFLGETAASTNASGSEGDASFRLDITNSTTITATRDGVSGDASVTCCIVEFSPSVFKSIQARSVTLTSANSSDTDTISSVDTNNTLLIAGGATCSTATETIFFYTTELTNSTTVTLTRAGSTATTSRTINYTVLEFQPGILKQAVQRNTTAMNNATSANTTISSVSTTNSIVNFCGERISATATANARTALALLSNATTVQCQKAVGGGAGFIVTVAWEVAEFV